MQKLLLSFVSLVVFLVSCTTETTIGNEIEFRKATMQGEYYPADKDSLANLIDRFADTTTMGTNGESGFYLNYIVMPHGKMEYTLQNARDAIRAITGYDFETFIFITDCNNDEDLKDFDIYDGQGYESSFGTVRVDTALRNKLKEKFPKNCTKEFQNNQKYNRFEPYMNIIAKLVPDKKIVPIVIGKLDKFQITELGDKIDATVRASKKNVLTVVITNFSEGMNQEEARKQDVPLIQSLESGNIFDLFRHNLTAYSNELRALKTGISIGQYGGANMFLPYLYNTSYNVFQEKSEFNNVKAYLAALAYNDPQNSYYSFSPLKKMTLMKEFVDSVDVGLRKGLEGEKIPNTMIVLRDFEKHYPFFLLVKKDGKLLSSKGSLSTDVNILYNAYKTSNDLGLNHANAKEHLANYDELQLEMFICNFPHFLSTFPTEGEINKLGFGLMTEKGEYYVVPGIDFEEGSAVGKVKEMLYQKAGIKENDKHILYYFDIFILEKNAPKEQE